MAANIFASEPALLSIASSCIVLDCPSSSYIVLCCPMLSFVRLHIRAVQCAEFLSGGVGKFVMCLLCDTTIGIKNRHQK